MAQILPFRAIRPKSRFAGAVVAPPYDAVSRREAEIIIHKNPLSFLRVLKPEATIPFFNTSPEIIYREAGKEFIDFLKKGIFIREKEPAFYLYTESISGHVQNGITGLFSCNDFKSGIIKGSEKVREFELDDRIRWIKSTRVQAGPVFLFYNERQSIVNLTEEILLISPLYDFETEDGVRHTVRRISDSDFIESIRNEFSSVERLYIADGNHRTHAACSVNSNGYFLATAVPHTEVRFFSYDRVVKNFKVSINFALTELSKFFEIKETDELFRPAKKGRISMLLNDKNFVLKTKKEFLTKPDVELLDSILSGKEGTLFAEGIEYVSGKVSPGSIKNAVKDGRFDAAFLLSPPTISEIVSAADSGKLLPAKSVWFDPKFRSGLFLNPLDADFNPELLYDFPGEEFGVWE